MLPKTSQSIRATFMGSFLDHWQWLHSSDQTTAPGQHHIEWFSCCNMNFPPIAICILHDRGTHVVENIFVGVWKWSSTQQPQQNLTRSTTTYKAPGIPLCHPFQESSLHHSCTTTTTTSRGASKPSSSSVRMRTDSQAQLSTSSTDATHRPLFCSSSDRVQ